MDNKSKAWIGIDFDGTLYTHFNHKKDGDGKSGELIENIYQHILDYRRLGYKIKILTARTEHKDLLEVKNKLESLGLGDIEITNVKDRHMKLLYDDRAIGVVRNIGITHQNLFYLINEFANRMPIDTPFRNDIISLSQKGFSSVDRALAD